MKPFDEFKRDTAGLTPEELKGLVEREEVKAREHLMAKTKEELAEKVIEITRKLVGVAVKAGELQADNFVLTLALNRCEDECPLKEVTDDKPTSVH